MWIGLFVAAALFMCVLVSSVLLLKAYRAHRFFAHMTTYWVGRLYENDEVIGGRIVRSGQGKQVSGDAGAQAIRTDRFGFRIPLSVDQETEVRQHGIVGIGCSFVFGFGVEAEETIPYIVGERLRLPSYNLGAPSYSMVTSYLWLSRHIRRLKPLLVVYGFTNFHLNRSTSPTAPTVYGTLFQAFATDEGGRVIIRPPLDSNQKYFELGRRIERLYFVDRLLGKPVPITLARSWAMLSFTIEDYRRRLLLVAFNSRAPKRPEDFDLAMEMLGRLLRLCEKNGARLLVVYIPSYYPETCSEGVLRAVDVLTKSDKFIFLDASASLFAQVRNDGEFMRSFSLSRYDRHPNARRDAAIARAVVERVKELNLVPVGPGGSSSSAGPRE